METETDTVGWGGCSVPSRDCLKTPRAWEAAAVGAGAEGADEHGAGPGPAHPQLLSELHLTEDKANKRYPPWLKKGPAGGLCMPINYLELMQNLSAGADVSQGSGISLKKDFLGGFSSWVY